MIYVAGPEASWADGVRFRALRDHGAALGLHTHKIGPFLPTFEGGHGRGDGAAGEAADGGDRLQRPDGHRRHARAASRAGLKVPDQVSVIGFDDILISRLVLPTLTTVAAPTRQMGMTAVEQRAGDHQGRQARRRRGPGACPPS